MEPTPIYLEVGAKRTFASAVEWPGWCRSGKDEESAIEAMLAYAPRFALVAKAFRKPSGITIVERLKGDATTDFGAPGAKAKADAVPIEGSELKRHLAILRACWTAFDAAVAAAKGEELDKGPRGGGRDLEKIVDHARDSEASYISALGGKAGTASRLAEVHEAFLVALNDRAQGSIPDLGPRGGKRWPVRFAIRRTAWHVLDHAWEIEDRSSGHR